MTTYSQYDLTSGFTSATATGGDSRTWTASGAIVSNAVRYNWTNNPSTLWDIAFNTSASPTPHIWRDDRGTFPAEFSNDGVNFSVSGCPDAQTIYIRDSANGAISFFQSPQWQYSSANTSGSGGPGTLSVVSTGWTYKVPAGVVPVEEPGRELFLNIAASAPTDSYQIYHDGVYHSTVYHTTGTVSSSQDTNVAKEYVLYRGTVQTSSSLNIIVATFTRMKKVSCNFW